MSLCQSFRSHLQCALLLVLFFFLFRYLFLISNNRNLWFIISLFFVGHMYLILSLFFCHVQFFFFDNNLSRISYYSYPPLTYNFFCDIRKRWIRSFEQIKKEKDDLEVWSARVCTSTNPSSTHNTTLSRLHTPSKKIFIYNIDFQSTHVV